MGGGGGSATWTYIVGVSAAKMGDMVTAEAAETALKDLTAKAQGGPTSYAAKPHLIREKELGAIIRWAKGQKDEALAFAKEAADAEKTHGGAVRTARADQAGVRAVRRDADGGRTGQGSGAGLRAVAAADAEAHAVGEGPGEGDRRRAEQTSRAR